MTTLGWFHCFAGISGDMALGACLDAGAPLEEVRSILALLPVEGWSLEATPVMRGGFAATRAVVEVPPEEGAARTAADLVAMVVAAGLPQRVEHRARLALTLLGEAEGRLHRRPPEETILHELGGLDTLVDIVGTAAGLELLGVDQLTASPVAVGRGGLRASHGMLPNPAPAVLELLAGASIFGVDLDFELTTPTGAALLRALCSGFGAVPPLRMTSSGFGAGARDLDGLPNVTRLVVGEAEVADRAPEASLGDPLVLLEANLDDVSGEIVGYTLEELLASGALDAWTVPVGMKKSRPGVVVSALCHPSDAPRLRDLLLRETGSFGVRATRLERFAAPRAFAEVEIAGRPVRVKRSAERRKAEYEDAAAVAREAGYPLREVVALAESAAGEPGRRSVIGATRVRAARPGEHAEVGRLTVESYRALPRSPGEGYVAELANVADRLGAGGIVLVAEGADGSILGTVTLFLGPGPYFEHDYGVEGDCTFRMLAVAPGSWGRGAGSALVEGCLSLARQAGRQQMVIASVPWMTTAHRLYERLGFQRRPDYDQWWGNVLGMAFVLPLDPP
ncbi:MAG: nickel pincer cofactor biosynthesis protein LarC [Acidimicrobiia bacterium]